MVAFVFGPPPACVCQSVGQKQHVEIVNARMCVASFIIIFFFVVIRRSRIKCLRTKNVAAAASVSVFVVLLPLFVATN